VVFTWDPKKAASNLGKHGVGFPEASSVIGDPLATTFPDEDHSLTEHRFVTVGVSRRNRVLVVIHTDQRNAVRIISARKAIRREVEFYENR
jgi:uncharacterized protein